MAGLFGDEINSRADFFDVLEKAKRAVATVRTRLPKDPTLASVERQLERVDQRTANGREPTQDERADIDMGFRMAREFEGTRDPEIYKLRQLVSSVNHYFEHWPDDRTAADPNNADDLLFEKP
jgi:hypothetical protein